MDDKMMDQRLVSNMQNTVAWMTARLAEDLDAAKTVLTVDNTIPVLIGTTDMALVLLKKMATSIGCTPEEYLQNAGRMLARMGK